MPAKLNTAIQIKENKMKLDLTIEEINQILNLLGQAPYNQVFQLIQKIQQQGIQQTEEKIW